MESGKVYVVHNDWIKNPDAGEGTMTYKIGLTTDSVNKRYYGLGLQMPGKFKCDFAYEFDSEKYKKVEKTLHKMLSKLNVGGEWFDLDADTLDGIQEVCEMAGGKRIQDEISEDETEEEVGSTSNRGGGTTREAWMEKAPWVVEAADSLKKVLSGTLESIGLRYVAEYIAITSSNNKYLTLKKRSKQNGSFLGYHIKVQAQNKLIKLLKENGIEYIRGGGGWGSIKFVDKQLIEKHKDVFIKLAEFVRDCKER